MARNVALKRVDLGQEGGREHGGSLSAWSDWVSFDPCQQYCADCRTDRRASVFGSAGRTSRGFMGAWLAHEGRAVQCKSDLGRNASQKGFNPR